MTPLIDIVFLLLIYFLLTSNYLTAEAIPVELPRAGSSALSSAGLSVVTIDDRGEVLFGGQSVSDQELFFQLERKMKNGQERSLLVRADRDVPLARVVAVLDVARRSGAKQLSLATERGRRPLPP
ncbi:ExbD/TolR family protein [Desulforhopalus singaporensis]|nr:biopolymer transporter ExbD [Desulforhopalus singaporensis]